MNKETLIQYIAEDIVDYYQTIMLMLQTRGETECCLKFAINATRRFQENDPTTILCKWFDIKTSLWSNEPISWDDCRSPIYEITNLYPGSTFEEKIYRFLSVYKQEIVSKIFLCMKTEGFQDYSVRAEEDYIVICSRF